MDSNSGSDHDNGKDTISEIEAGRVVRLASGGVPMTVQWVAPTPPFLASCTWHDAQGRPQERDYLLRDLVLIAGSQPFEVKLAEIAADAYRLDFPEANQPPFAQLSQCAQHAWVEAVRAIARWIGV